MNTPVCEPNACTDITASGLNRDCRCIGLDPERLKNALAADPHNAPLFDEIATTRPHLFAQLPVFVAQSHIAQMRAAIAAVERVVALPAYREHVLARAPAIARRDPGARGVFLGYDFHLGADGPQIIEINTNAGGALLNAALARAQRACCAEIEPLFVAPGSDRVGKDEIFIEMFLAEWRAQRGAAPLRRIAIVDDEPPQQYLWPEFLLFKRMFESAGYEAVIADAAELDWRAGRLHHDGKTVDLVYNRLTDFMLEQPAHAALRSAYLEGAVVLTPHPHAHALYANKRNLVQLSDPAWLGASGVASEVIDVLRARVPRSVEVSRTNAEELWERRRQLFFKPAAGFGSRAAYRGDKLTRRVWEQIAQSDDYIAQHRVEPSGRRILIGGELVDLKLDLRCYVYAGEVQLVAARLYQGQTTNFRTPGGGFAPVYTAPD